LKPGHVHQITGRVSFFPAGLSPGIRAVQGLPSLFALKNLRRCCLANGSDDSLGAMQFSAFRHAGR
jgi:hypothetical protein